MHDHRRPRVEPQFSNSAENFSVHPEPLRCTHKSLALWARHISIGASGPKALHMTSLPRRSCLYPVAVWRASHARHEFSSCSLVTIAPVLMHIERAAIAHDLEQQGHDLAGDRGDNLRPAAAITCTHREVVIAQQPSRRRPASGKQEQLPAEHRTATLALPASAACCRPLSWPTRFMPASLIRFAVRSSSHASAHLHSFYAAAPPRRSR